MLIWHFALGMTLTFAAQQEWVEETWKRKPAFRSIELWWARNFKVISAEKAKQLGLSHYRDVYGDEIIRINCRSIWRDLKDRYYRVE